MKDSTENRNEANDPNKGKGWEDPAFSWENMQDGIFGRIVEVDPDFFKKKRRRRLPIWFWFCVAIFAGGGLYYASSNRDVPSNPSNLGQPTQSSPSFKKEEQASTNQRKVEEKQQKLYAAPKNLEYQKPNKATQPNSNRTNKDYQKQQSVFHNLNHDPPISSENNNNQAVAKQNIGLPIVSEAHVQPTESTSLIESRQVEAAAFLATLDIPSFAVPTNFPIIQPFFLPKKENPNEKTQHNWSIAVNGGSLVSFSKYTGSSGSVALRNGHSSPWFGYQYGVGVGTSIAKKGQLFLNLNRQVAYQNIDIYTERRVEKTIPNALLSVERFVVGNRVIETHGDTTVGATEKNRLVHYNEQKSIQGQLGYAWLFDRKYWHFNLNSGLAMGYLTKQDGFTIAADGAILGFNNDRPIFRNFQFAPFAGLGIERDLGRRFAINMNYQFQKHINNASVEANTQLKPAFHSLSIGARLKLGKD
jgi:hypothetical protein